MPNGLPCPNPTCTYVFPIDAVKGVGTLTCPGCGKRFQCRAVPRSKIVPTAVAKPMPADPTPAAPVPDAIPVAAPTAEPAPSPPEAEADFYVPPPDQPLPRVQRTLARRGRRWARWVTPAVLLVLLVGLVVAGIRLAPHLTDMSLWPGPSKDDNGDSAATCEYPGLNCRFLLPDRPWQEDAGEARQALKARLVLKRSDPDAWLALATRDFKDRTPRADEVREEGVRRLENYFKDHLETEPGNEEAQLAGHPAQRLVFRGERDGASCSGEGYFFAHQGIAYWFFTWAPGNVVEEAREEFAALRQRFALLKANRDKWAERSVARTFQGHTIACTLEDQAGLWREWTPATDYDAAADLALFVKEQREGDEGGDRSEQMVATVLLLALPGRADSSATALQRARDHLAKQQEALGLRAKIEPDKEPDSDAPIGNVRGSIARFKMQLGETQRRFVLLAIVPRGEQVLVVQGECDERRRGDWEPRFLQLLEHFRLE